MTDHNTGLKKVSAAKKTVHHFTGGSFYWENLGAKSLQIIIAHHFCGCVPPPKLVILCGIRRPYSLCGVSPQNVGVRNNIILCGFEAASPPKALAFEISTFFAVLGWDLAPKRWHSKCPHSLLFWGGIWSKNVVFETVIFWVWGRYLAQFETVIFLVIWGGNSPRVLQTF